MATPLQEFLIQLGFKLDTDGLRRFNEQVSATHKVVRDFAVAITTMAGAVEEAVRRTTRQFENLFYLSQRTGVTVRDIQALRYAFTQVGLSAGDADASIQSLAARFRSNPGLAGLARQLTGSVNPRDVVLSLAKQYDQILKTRPQAEAGYRAFIENTFGLSVEMLRQVAVNVDQTIEQERRAQRIHQLWGFANERAAAEATKLGRTWNEVWENLKLGLDSFVVELFPVVDRLLKDFLNWLDTSGRAKVKRWTEEWGAWLRDPKNIDDIRDKLRGVLRVIEEMFHGVAWLIQKFKGLSDAIGPIGAVATTVFGLIVARALVAAAAVALLNGALLATGRALLFARGMFGAAGAGAAGAGAGAAGTGGILGLLGGLLGGGLAAGAAGVFLPDSAMGPKAQEARKGAVTSAATALNDFLHWVGRVTGYEDAQGRSTSTGKVGVPDAVIPNTPIPGGTSAPIPGAVIPNTPIPGGTSAPIPGARKSAYTGDEFGGGDSMDLLFRLFMRWWGGDSAFRPIVVLADEFYQKFSDVLTNLLLGKTGPEGAGAGAPSGPGGAGYGRVPGKGFGMRFGRGGGGAGPLGFEPGAAGGTSLQEMVTLAKQAGFSDKDAPIIAAIAMAESSGNLKAVGSVGERGLTQINPHAWGQQLAELAGSSPLGSFQAAKHVLEKQGWGAWSVYNSGMYRQYLGTAMNFAKPGSAQPGMSTEGGTGGAFNNSGILGGVNRVLASTLEAASTFLPKGYKVQPTSGYRPGDSGFHGRGLAMDVKIVGPDGTPISNRGQDATGMYARLAHAAFNAISRNHPELADRFAWGGEFGTEKGGGGPPDLMHFDLGGRRGRFHRNDWHYIDSDHNVNIHVHGAEHPEATARAVKDVQRRESALHTRNLRTALV